MRRCRSWRGCAAGDAVRRGTDDATLMLRYRDGDVRAFEILYERHKGAAVSLSAAPVPPREVANDLFQEVWSKVIASRSATRCVRSSTRSCSGSRTTARSIISVAAAAPQERGAQDVDDAGGASSAAPSTSVPTRRCPKRSCARFPSRAGAVAGGTARRVRALRGDRAEPGGDRPDHRRGDGNCQEPAALRGRQAARGAAASIGLGTFEPSVQS